MPFQIERLRPRDYRTIHKALKRDFHRDEIKPLWLILFLCLRGRYDGFLCQKNGQRVGYMLFLTDGKGHTLLDYYAMEPDFRAKGYGSAFFGAVCGRMPGLLLEVEDPDFAPDEADKATRLRRIAFYARNGCAMTGLHSEVRGVRYRIMAGPDAAFSDEAARAALTSLYSGMLGRAWVKRFIWME